MKVEFDSIANADAFHESLSQPSPQREEQPNQFRCHNCKRVAAVVGTLAPERCVSCKCRDFSAVAPATPQPAGGVAQERDIQFEVWQDDMMVASSTSETDARHYLAVYEQDGPAYLVRAETIRHRLGLPAALEGEG